MFDTYFPAFGITADSARVPCGMHVNVSNALFGKTRDEQVEAIRKLYYIINKHYGLFKKAFYRAGSTTYCGQMNYTAARTLDLEYQPNDHGLCMNLSHFRAGRIEIRLVGGQKNFYCFRNTMETVFHLIKRVRTISWAQCDNIAEIFRGCNQYVLKRLRTECELAPEVLQAIESNIKLANF
jgi:hypothetical protein